MPREIRETVYLDAHQNFAPPDRAVWMVETTLDAAGHVVAESWVEIVHPLRPIRPLPTGAGRGADHGR
ncbi:MAG: hypothetical protein AB1586_02900 [Pseudomonadota bacterium]